ncbi:MAG: choice-of-anchor tandem repeat GloVer-containing protein, partial [Candidatus Cybelea sp.]
MCAHPLALTLCVAIAGCSRAASIPPGPPGPSTTALATRPVRDSFTAIYSFRGGSGDGAYPNGGLTEALGVLFGTTAGGGPTGAGTIYETSTSGAESPVHIFTGDPDGDDPWPPPIKRDGAMYGTTAGGGTANLGAVYEIGRHGGEHILYSFQGGSDGQTPIAGLMKYRGIFYGATLYGGTYSDGTVFAVTPSGKEHVLHSFGASGDGQNPYTTLFARSSLLYGTAVNGGAYGGGTVFTITPSGTETTLYSFGGASGDGVSPRGVPVAVGGELYATTEFGGAYGQGTIYKITTAGQEQVLHSFGGSDAEDPTDGLYYYNRAFYGTGYQG